MGDDGFTEIDDGHRVRVTRRAGPGELAEWDRFVEAVPLSDVTQLSGWSVVRAEVGFAPLHVFVHRSGDPVGGAQILARRIPAVGSLGYLSGGPLVAGDIDDRAGVVRSLGSAMLALLGSQLRALFVQPPAGADDVSVELARRGFRPSHAGIAPAASLRIDLGADVEELRARLNKRLRAWTRRWPDKGVHVRVGGDDDLPLLAQLVARSAEFQRYEPLSLEYLRLMYRSLAPTGRAVLFVGEVHGQPVAVDLYTRCGGVLRDRLIGFDRNSEASKLSVPAALKWYAMLWAKDHGMRWFDFGGIRPKTAEALLAGRSLDQASAGGSDFFKISFGGEPFLMPPAVEDARPRRALLVYDLAQRSERGRALVSKLQRRLRGGGRSG
ncbi:MAG TPA: GNAT family N-acetyltransferase [Miltoncostaeaceae bacterium]|nr:GNAT family N-acetyltransferase [Miltoncostaeaceae bacterium]